MPEEKKPENIAKPKPGWGKENYPMPEGVAFIECDEMKCTGCGICQMACSMQHFGVLNKDLSRIQVNKYLLPIAKGIQTTCSQCQKEERKCEPACPLDPPAIYYDSKLFHMVIDRERCLGDGCLQCRDACPAKAIRNHPKLSPTPFVCDLCDTENNGKRDPECVNVCPCGALHFLRSPEYRFGYSVQDITRIHADEKAEMIAKRLYPLVKKSVAYPGWR